MSDLIHILSQLPGWSTRRRIVVIESDDWGSIRMPSKDVYESLLRTGYAVDKDLFSRYDSLERSADLEALFDILHSVKDSNGHPALITANSVVANPDFDRIANQGFSTYFYEPATESYKHQPGCENSYNTLVQGIAEKMWRPQLHGREHLNVIRWMMALRSGDEVARYCFNQRHFSLTKKASSKVNARYMDAFSNASLTALDEEKAIVGDACDIFERMYGFRSKSFIAPCYIWKRELEPVLKDNGIDYLQGLPLQQIPVKDDPLQFKPKYHYLGQRNQWGQRYLIRNAFFEPYKGGLVNGVDECLGRISLAFKCHKPAIISSHRLNYIGSLDIHHRDKSLALLKTLLNRIVKQWSEIEFMSSDQLGDIICGK